MKPAAARLALNRNAADDEEMARFREWLGKAQQEGRRKRLDEAPAPGMRPDRSIEFLEPGQPKPQPRIIKIRSG